MKAEAQPAAIQQDLNDARHLANEEYLARVQAEQARDEARQIVARVNNSVFGSDGYFIVPACVEAVEDLKVLANRRFAELTTLRAQQERLRALLRAVLGWRALDGDGISDPLRGELVAAVRNAPDAEAEAGA